MKIKEVIPPPVSPPRTVVLELSLSEAGLIYRFAGYYASAYAGTRVAGLDAAARLKSKLETYKTTAVYPYTEDFEDD